MQHAPSSTLFLALLIATAPAAAMPESPPAPSPPSEATAPPDVGQDMPLYPEEADGESTLWLDVAGYAQWFTDRGPLGTSTPLAFGVGFAHRVGPARLAWRAQFYRALPDDDALSFLYVDLLSVEYVFDDGTVRPWLRGALGVGLDLTDSDLELPDYGNPSLGDDGYFNEDNGASGGFGITLGGGVDLFFADAFFVRADLLLRAYGGAGQPGVMAGAHVGPGFAW